MGGGGSEDQRGLGINNPKQAQLHIDERKYGQTDHHGPKGKGFNPKKYLSKSRLPSGIPRRPTRGRFVSRTRVEEKGKLRNMDGQLNTSQLLIGY